MKQTNLEEALSELVTYLKAKLFTEEDAYKQLVDIIHQRHGKEMMPLFQRIRELDLAEERKVMDKLYQGLEESMHNTSVLLQNSSNKSRRKFNDEVKYITEHEAHMIRTAIAYFPNGLLTGASYAGKWYLEQVIQLIMKNKADYEENGNNRDWAERLGYLDWIENILKIYNDDGSLRKQDD